VKRFYKVPSPVPGIEEPLLKKPRGEQNRNIVVVLTINLDPRPTFTQSLISLTQFLICLIQAFISLTELSPRLFSFFRWPARAWHRIDTESLIGTIRILHARFDDWLSNGHIGGL
jgi:hypothetical protein